MRATELNKEQLISIIKELNKELMLHGHRAVLGTSDNVELNERCACITHDITLLHFIINKIERLETEDETHRPYILRNIERDINKLSTITL